MSYKDERHFYTECPNVRKLSQSVGEWRGPMLQKLIIVNTKTKSKQHLQYLLDEATNVLPTYNLSEKGTYAGHRKQPKVQITYPLSTNHTINTPTATSKNLTKKT